MVLSLIVMRAVSSVNVGVAGRVTMTVMAQLSNSTMMAAGVTTVPVLGVDLRMVSVTDLLHHSVETVVLVRGVLNDASGAIGFLQ